MIINMIDYIFINHYTLNSIKICLEIVDNIKITFKIIFELLKIFLIN